jgi:hypothetical protein
LILFEHLHQIINLAVQLLCMAPPSVVVDMCNRQLCCTWKHKWVDLHRSLSFHDHLDCLSWCALQCFQTVILYKDLEGQSKFLLVSEGCLFCKG